MNRLPPTRFPEDAAASSENASPSRPSGASGAAGQGGGSGSGGGARGRSMPAPPPFESHSSSGSTKYSPSASSPNKLAPYSSIASDDPSYLLGGAGTSSSALNSDRTLNRDVQGYNNHPSAAGPGASGITWAASPDAGRPNAFPTLSYGGQGGPSVHPGITQRGSDSGFTAPIAANLEAGQAGGVRRGKSMNRPERDRLDERSRFFNYRQHAAVYEAENTGRIGPSTTGNNNAVFPIGVPFGSGQGGISAVGLAPGKDGRPGIRRGKSILAREEGMANDSGLNFLKRGATLRRKKERDQYETTQQEGLLKSKQDKTAAQAEKAPLGWWMIYCYIITAFLPGFFLKKLGYTTLDRRRAFREKIGLLSVIASLMAAVGFLTFGFTNAVCDNSGSRFRTGTVQGGSMIFHGYDYAMDTFQHPAAAGIETNSNPLYADGWNAGGQDGSFMFQKVNQNCKGVITPATGSAIPYDSATGDMGWYFPCNLFNQYGTTAVNQTGYAEGQLCHTSSSARTLFDEGRTMNVSGGFAWQGPVYYTWDDIKNASRNLGVYKGAVLDFSLLNWLDRTYVDYPAVFDDFAAGTTTYERRDATMQLLIGGNRTIAECMDDMIRVGFVDSKSMGCIVADIVLYISLVFILAVVGIKFGMAVVFSWFFGRRMGAFKNETQEDRQKKMNEVEAWTNDIFRPAPAKYRPNVKGGKKGYLPTTSRFTPSNRYTYSDNKRQSNFGHKAYISGIPMGGTKASPPDTPVKTSRSNISLPSTSNFGGRDGAHSRSSSYDMVDSHGKPCPFPLDMNIIPQPPPDYQPHHFPLAHTILLVTAYSESVEGLRTTLDSLATTDYPNSHKLILVIADGVVKGAGNDLSTPDIVLTMMKDFVVPKEQVEPHSYVAVADGHKRHNMAKVYAGFYEYDDETVESSKQQRVPMILVAKCGNPLEAHDAKPGNRGKRDSQIVLMAFLQKVMFDERMTSFEYEFFNSIWRTTGISADNYEHVLMVDADTKVFPDSVTRMVACMVQDTDIMGLCGETKIANKKETWVTMIQVFEYYISHHQTKAFESMWGGVTCLPGCFSMYRIKAPKGPDGYWVPILANPDIVEHYSENVVDNLHKKNLLLLGEDRYLTTLMLKTFPKRKMMFCPQAYCKTVVPDTFRVLLSQRRRWINSTIHNLFELLLVRDLCGTFCFSMQFVVFMELVGTLVLPAAIAFTIYILVLTCIPNREKPVIPLILLACILGLPGILIVVTSRKFAYVGWMVIYLFSLPIWNAVLPAYAYFHMDDFSWGSTRKIEGEGKGGGHGDKEGEFDSNAISMKRWTEWERERRWRNGTGSRGSTYDLHQRASSPNRSSINRTSIISTADTFVSQGGNPQDPFYKASAHPVGYSTPSPVSGRRAVDNVQVLELPAPLSATPQTQPYQHVPSTTEIYDAADPSSLHNYEASPYQSSSSENFHQTGSRAEDEYPQYSRGEGYESDSAEREAMMRTPGSPEAFYPAQSASIDSMSSVARTPSPGMVSTAGTSSTQPRESSVPPSRQSRGVSLYDPGPVSAPDGAVRVVQRNRRTSQARGRQSTGDGAMSPTEFTATSPISRSSGNALPPGAAPRR